VDPLDALARAPLRPYYLLHGDEPFLVERALGVLRSRLVPDGTGGTWRTVWAEQDASRLGAALEDLASPSLFGGARILVVRHAEALRDEEQDLVLGTLPTLGDGGTLILVAASGDQRRRLLAACVKAGAAVAFPPLPDGRAAEAWAARLVRERGHEIAPAALRELVDRVGNDLGVLDGEIEKLSLRAAGGRRIETADVRALTTAARAHRIDELTDRLGRRDRAGALRVLRSLLAEGEPPIRAAAFLAANLRRALHVAELAEEGLGTERIASRLGMPAWLVERNAQRGSARALAHALGVLGRLDLELKSSRPAEVVFEAALLEIAG